MTIKSTCAGNIPFTDSFLFLLNLDLLFAAFSLVLTCFLPQF